MESSYRIKNCSSEDTDRVSTYKPTGICNNKDQCYTCIFRIYVYFGDDFCFLWDHARCKKYNLLKLYLVIFVMFHSLLHCKKWIHWNHFFYLALFVIYMKLFKKKMTCTIIKSFIFILLVLIFDLQKKKKPNIKSSVMLCRGLHCHMVHKNGTFP